MESLVGFYQEAQKSLHVLPSYERAEMTVELAKSFERACVAYCSGPGAQVPEVGSPRVSEASSGVGGPVYRVCGSPTRSVGSRPATGSGYWSVPSGLSVSSKAVASDGRCYLALASRGCRTALYRRLGPWPTFARLLASPSGKFSLDEMRASSLVRVSDGTWHVAARDHHPPSSVADFDVASVLCRLVEDNVESLQVQSAKWEGTLLRDLQLESPPLGSMDVPSPFDKIGGLGEPPPEAGFDVRDLVRPFDLGSKFVVYVLGGALGDVVGLRIALGDVGFGDVPELLVDPSVRGLAVSSESQGELLESWRRAAVARSDLVVHFAGAGCMAPWETRFMWRAVAEDSRRLLCVRGAVHRCWFSDLGVSDCLPPDGVRSCTPAELGSALGGVCRGLGSFGSGVAGSSSAVGGAAGDGVAGSAAWTDVAVYPAPVPVSSARLVYLGGSSEKGSRRWREQLVHSCRDLDYFFVSHCGFGRWSGDDGGLTPEKVVWERRAMDAAGCVVLRLADGASSAASLIELGRFLESPRLVVCCGAGHWAHSVVRAMSVAYGFECVDSEGSLRAALARRAARAGLGPAGVLGGPAGSAVGSSVVDGGLSAVAERMLEDARVGSFGAWQQVVFAHSERSGLRFARTAGGALALVMLRAGSVAGVLPLATSDLRSAEAARAVRAALVCSRCYTTLGVGCCDKAGLGSGPASNPAFRFFMPVGCASLRVGSAEVLEPGFFGRFAGYVTGLRAALSGGGGLPTDFSSYCGAVWPGGLSFAGRA